MRDGFTEIVDAGELAALKAERDRYREALRLIVGDDPPYADFQFAGREEDQVEGMVRCAREALEAGS